MIFNLQKINLIKRNYLKTVLFYCSLLIGITLFYATATKGGTFTVTRNDDRNTICNSGVDCSLREAVNAAANAGFQSQTINFANGLAIVSLTAEIEIVPAGSLTINGPGANALTIDGSTGTNRIFYINNTDVTITGVTLEGGNGDGTLHSGVGGAIYASAGQVTLDSVVVKNNGGGALLGGGVALVGGTHRIINSTLSGNTSNKCGGIYASGLAVYIVNSTISGNTATTGINGVSQGAGLCNGGTTTVRNSTITNNTSGGANSQSGGVYNFQLTLDIGNTIIAGNTAINYPEIRNESTITSAGNNLIGDSAGDATATQVAITYQASDILNTPPMLGLLQLNGGNTPTHALLAGSPAIDAGSNALAIDPYNNSALTTDQRGLTRIFDGNADSVSTADIGAFEAQAAPTAATVTVRGHIQTAKGQAIGNASIMLTNSKGETETVISGVSGEFQFANVQAGETYIFTVRSKHCQFNETTRVRSITEDINDLDFIAVATSREI